MVTIIARSGVITFGFGRELEKPMLILKPNCECCDTDLPPDSTLAVICTFECTFCKSCAEERFSSICPNCGGELLRRPVRPAEKLLHHPAAADRYVGKHPECAGERS